MDAELRDPYSKAEGSPLPACAPSSALLIANQRCVLQPAGAAARPCRLSHASGSPRPGEEPPVNGPFLPSPRCWTSRGPEAAALRQGPEHTAWPGRSGQRAGLFSLPNKPREGFQQLLAGSMAGDVATWQKHLGFCLCWGLPTAQLEGKSARYLRQQYPTRGTPGGLRSNLHTSLDCLQPLQPS